MKYTKIYDISPTISEATPVWPGDTPFQRQISMNCDDGDHLTLSSINTTLHIGAHADAPNHYLMGKAAIDQVDLSVFMGTCIVIEAMHKPLVEIKDVKCLEEKIKQQNINSDFRVLLKTQLNHPTTFSDNFAAIAPETIGYLANLGCVLIGIDTPSVDPFSSKTLDTHKQLAEHGVLNLEGLDLSLVPADTYYLVALPLKLKNADASPVRAVLLK